MKKIAKQLEVKNENKNPVYYENTDSTGLYSVTRYSAEGHMVYIENSEIEVPYSKRLNPLDM